MEILLVLQIVVVVALIAIILVQKSTSDGFTGGGSPNSFLTGRASANLFTRTTAILATIFIVNSMVLAYIASHTERGASILDQAAEEASKEKSTNPGSEKDSGTLKDLQRKLDNNLNPQENKTSEQKPTEEKPVEEKSPENKKPNSPSVPVSE